MPLHLRLKEILVSRQREGQPRTQEPEIPQPVQKYVSPPPLGFEFMMCMMMAPNCFMGRGVDPSFFSK